jgi:hypothetical protein
MAPMTKHPQMIEQITRISTMPCFAVAAVNEAPQPIIAGTIVKRKSVRIILKSMRVFLDIAHRISKA